MLVDLLSYRLLFYCHIIYCSTGFRIADIDKDDANSKRGNGVVVVPTICTSRSPFRALE